MCDFETKFRTNYFSVTSLDQLKKLCAMQPSIEIEQNEDGKIALIGYELWKDMLFMHDCKKCYNYSICNNTSCTKPCLINWLDAFQKIISDDELVIIQEILNEKNLRYICAHSIIITNATVDYIDLTKLTVKAAKRICGNPRRNFDDIWQKTPLL